MTKRKMVQSNLVKNSIAAYYAAIEIHNKPNISYRYETVTLLIINSWELALKAYVKKFCKKRSIYKENGDTIALDKALDYVTEHGNSIVKGSFIAIKENILAIEEYRNNVTHFYCDELEPYIFMLVARSALNYVEFMKECFKKDIMEDEGLFIIPLGFKLPFRPEDFLSQNVAKYASSEEAKAFINGIVKVTRKLQQEGVEDSIVLGFDIYLESVKKATNSDILAAITTIDKADVSIAKITNVRFSADASQICNLNDDEFRKIWKYSHAELVKLCKENIVGFKQDKRFIEAKKSIANDVNCVYERKLDNKNPKSSSQKFYTDEAFNSIKKFYEGR